MKRNGPKKSEKQTLEEKQNLIKTFSVEDQYKIKQLVTDLRKIRRIDREGDVAIDEQLQQIAEQQFYYIGDFIISEGWNNDRPKIETLWKYLQLELS